MPTTITCYGGVNEIGGNKILLQDGEHRLLLDFGKPFGRYGGYFDGVFIKERSGRGLLDFLSLELLPPLRGLLRDDLLPALDPTQVTVTQIPPTGRQRKSREVRSLTSTGVEDFWSYWARLRPYLYADLRRDHAPPVDVVLISHAHQDHLGDIVYLSLEIPAVSTRMTAFIAKVLVDVGQGGLGAPYANPYRLDPHSMLIARGAKEYLSRPWVFLDGDPEGSTDPDALETAASFWAASPASTKSLTPQKGGLPSGLKLRYWSVDHSIYGAVGYAVETEAGWVAYTGDLRFHGKHGAKTRQFAEALAKLKPVALLCEGTRLTEPNQTTEMEVYQRCLQAVQSADRELVIADFAPRNIERVEAFLEIARQTSRLLLLQPRDAYLVRAMHLAEPAAFADLMDDPHVAVYDDPKASQRKWEQVVRARYASRIVSPQMVVKNPGEYILAFSLTDMVDLLDLQYLMGGQISGVYIFSNSKAYDDEQKVDLERLWNWTQLLGLTMVGLKPPRRSREGALEIQTEPGYHASGHAGMDELAEFVHTVRPKTLIPIHIERPERWEDLLEGTKIRIVYPEYGRPISLI